MHGRAPRLFATLMLTAGLSACSSPADEAAPVAAPSALLATADVEAGSVVDVTYRFAVSTDAPPFEDDYTVFVHAFDEDGRRVWTDDHAPATPTRQWKPGSVIEYTHAMFIPGRAKEGRIRLDIGLYSPRTGDRLPLAGPGIGDRSYQIASLRVHRLARDQAMFIEGWYDVEAPEDVEGIEWRWSHRRGEVWFRNPKKDSIFILQLDRAVSGLPEPTLVEIRVGAAVVDSFRLPPGQLELRRTSISASQLGDDEIARIEVAVDKSFVPATLPEAQSPDTRELGVRVFEAHLVPQ